MSTFFGFAISDSMFSASCELRRRELTVEQAREIIEQGVEPCLNPSHKATISAMQERFGISVAIPERPPRVSLRAGDRLLVMGVRGLPRLVDRHEYTSSEIDGASFKFALWEVVKEI